MDDSDEALMVRAGRGDRTACEELVARHLGHVVRFAHRTLGNRADAEDAAQDVFLRVWSASRRWKHGQARFSTWLYRVAMNVCLDRIAKNHERGAQDADEIADPRPDPSVTADARQVAEVVTSSLSALPDKQRIAITLCYYQQMSNRDAAEVLGVSVEALESLLARARQSLRAHLHALAPLVLEKR